jgi:hypothetical protein
VTTPFGSSARGGEALTLDAYAERQQLGPGEPVTVEAELVAEPSGLEDDEGKDDVPF